LVLALLGKAKFLNFSYQAAYNLFHKMARRLRCHGMGRDFDPDLHYMDSSVPGSICRPSAQVKLFLSARGIPPEDLPPDMMRELTRLMADESGEASRTGGRRSGTTPAAKKEHHHDMLSFEMYLAAWIAREGMCDRPKRRRRRTRKPPVA
jgi:hypothetical protein